MAYYAQAIFGRKFYLIFLKLAKKVLADEDYTQQILAVTLGKLYNRACLLELKQKRSSVETDDL